MMLRNMSASAWGKPRNLTMTRTGMCWAYSSAASKLVRPSVAASSSRQRSRVNGSMAAIGLGVKAGSSIRRTMLW